MASPRHRDYALQPLLYPAIPQPQSHPNSPAAVALSLRCAEGHGSNLYLGTSDGVIHHYRLGDEGSSTSPDQFQLVDSKTISSSGKPIEKILVLHKIGLAAILCESTLSFLHLPNLDPLPPRLLPSTRGVSTVVLDDAETEGVDAEGFVSLCVIKRRQAALIKVGMGRCITIKEVPLPPGVVLARRYGDVLCTASTSEYNLVNLTTSHITPLGLPISHSAEAPSASTRPSILSLPLAHDPAECEFLITSHSEDQSLGVFVRSDGEPSPKLIEWQSHPRALFVDAARGQLISLLRNDVIEVHDLESMQCVQKIPLPDALEPRLLSTGASTLQIAEPQAQPAAVQVDVAERSSTPSDFAAALRHPSWRSAILSSSRRTATVIVSCRNAVQCLTEPVELGEALRALASGNWSALQRLVDEAWAAKGGGDDAVLRALYSLLTLRYISLLDFYAAGQTFRRSTLDVRLLLRLFPDLWVCGEGSATVDVFPALAGLVSSQWQPVEEAIEANLAWLYGSHVAKTDDRVQRLREQLTTRAYDMVESILTTAAGAAAPREITDTALGKLYARRHDGEKLCTLLLQPRSAADVDAILSTSENVRTLDGVAAALGELYFSRQQWAKAVEVWARLIEEGQATRGIPDIVDALQRCDEATQHRYALWLVRYDTQAAVKLLAGLGSRGATGRARSGSEESDDAAAAVAPVASSPADIGKIIAELHAAGAHDAADRFVEHLVLRSGDEVDIQPHRASLIDSLLDRLLAAIDGDASARDFYAEAMRDYRQGGYAESFVAHLALRRQEAPREALLLERFKLIFLLQASAGRDIAERQQALLERIQTAGDLLSFEQAILLGALDKHREVLRLLAVVLRDANSAEVYCIQGGNVVLGPWAAECVASAWDGEGEEEESTLKPYAAMLAQAAPATTAKGSRARKDELLRTLLSLYLDGGDDDQEEGTATPTYRQHAVSQLSSSHATGSLDALTVVLPLVPPHWPLRTLSTSLIRSLRRRGTARCRGSVERGLALADSLEKSERAWGVLRGLGGVVQDEDEQGGGANGNEQAEAAAESVEGVEKVGVVEKAQRAPRVSRGGGGDAAVEKRTLDALRTEADEWARTD